FLDLRQNSRGKQPFNSATVQSQYLEAAFPRDFRFTHNCHSTANVRSGLVWCALPNSLCTLLPQPATERQFSLMPTDQQRHGTKLGKTIVPPRLLELRSARCRSV